MEIKYTQKAKKQLAKILKSDRQATIRILSKIELLAANQIENLDIKKLKGQYEDLFRLRVGKYRVIYDNDFNIINVLK